MTQNYKPEILFKSLCLLRVLVLNVNFIKIYRTIPILDNDIQLSFGGR